MTLSLLDNYREALFFAESAHREQRIPGTDVPYILHCTLVAAEILAADRSPDSFDLKLAMLCALLHDTVEDTAVTLHEISNRFGSTVAAGVAALTKNPEIPKPDRMSDSLARILEQPREIGMVKMADRITNLAPPPQHWPTSKRLAYREEAGQILSSLRHCNDFLAKRLERKIEEYVAYC